MNRLHENELLSIEVTTRCNSGCSYCFARANLDYERDIPLETALDFIKEAAGMGYNQLHITGGEPLLYPGIEELLIHARNQGYLRVLVNTNGHLINHGTIFVPGDFTDILELTFTLQGPPEYHDIYRGPDSWEKAARGLDIAHDAGIPITIFTPLGRSLLDRLPRFAEYAFERWAGIKGMNLIQMIRVPGQGIDLSGELLRPVDFITLVQKTSLMNLFGMKISLLENPLGNAVARVMGMEGLPASENIHRPGRIILMADHTLAPAHSSGDIRWNYTPGKLEEMMYTKGYLSAVEPDHHTCPACPFHEICGKAGMTRPSSPNRDTEEALYCKRVMSLAAPSHRVTYSECLLADS
jgi:MoaA/NifB/PqqE/SkfB family radical SAM enzyme